MPEFRTTTRVVNDTHSSYTAEAELVQRRAERCEPSAIRRGQIAFFPLRPAMRGCSMLRTARRRAWRAKARACPSRSKSEANLAELTKELGFGDPLT